MLYEIYAGRKYLAGMPELKIASCVGYQDDWQPVSTTPEPAAALQAAHRRRWRPTATSASLRGGWSTVWRSAAVSTSRCGTVGGRVRPT